MLKRQDSVDNGLDLGNVIREYFASLCAVAFKFTGDYEAARDIVQDVIVKFWEMQGKKGFSGSLGDFLFILTRNESLNYLRSLGRERRRHEQVAEESPEMDDAVWNTVVEQESNQLLLEAIASLSPREQRVIELALEGKTNREIGEVLEIAENTVKVLKNRSIHKLREWFRRNDVQIDF